MYFFETCAAGSRVRAGSEQGQSSELRACRDQTEHSAAGCKMEVVKSRASAAARQASRVGGSRTEGAHGGRVGEPNGTTRVW